MARSREEAPGGPGPGIGSTTHEPGDWTEGVWASRQVAAMAAAWERGERVTAAEILRRHPDLDTEAAIRLIYEEVCLRREAGLEVDTAEVVRQYPRWADELQDLFDCDRLLGPPGDVVTLPAVGETLGPFRLLAELGRGATGRTYLATDPGLADRPVVVKIIPDDQDEHLALARLRHTHIVPLFSEHSFPERGLRVLCMPYLGGASLAQLLHDLADIPLSRRSGKLLVELVDRNTRHTPAPLPAESPFRRGLEQASYVEAMTWIAACLADALHYAQARGLVHMDIKPSNVLITVDGQPMLLDFHLARGPIRPGDWIADRLGGTPGWMSPEQQRAMEAVEGGRPVVAAVDGRTDIFALGLLLREALAPTGWTREGPGKDARDLVHGLPGVSVGLGDILRKCLAPDPSERYEDAATLAEDLRRHVNDLPLRGVGNRSPIERWRKWRRRHPGALAWGFAGLAILLAATGALAVSAAAYRRHVGQLRNALEDGQRQCAAGRYGDAIRTLQRGLEDAGSVVAVGEVTQALRAELARAQRGQRAEELHELADRIRFRYGIDLPSDEDARALVRHCRAIWEQRGHLLPAGGVVAMENAAERRIQGDLLELAAVWADLRLRLASPGELDAVRREVLRLLDEADAAFGPSLAIDLRRASLAAAPAPVAEADARTRASRSAWEHYDMGRYHLRRGRFAPAAAEFRRALDRRPQDFWSNFYQGLCAFRLRQFEDAVAAFRACLTLEPQSAICRYNRALAHDALGQMDRAHDDYTRAIELDPTLAPARLNRGILSYNRGRMREAIDDFEHALDLSSSDPETLGRLHYNLALAQLAQGDRVAARANVEEAVRYRYPEARSLADDLHAGRAVLLPPARGTPGSSAAEDSATSTPE